MLVNKQGPCLTPSRLLLMEKDAVRKDRNRKDRRRKKKERERRSEGGDRERDSGKENKGGGGRVGGVEGRVVRMGGGFGLAQCDIQSGDESQHKKLKAAAEISRLISIQIRHKFYMPNV